MTLPAITLPKVELPFDLAVLLHPPVVHFMIALPVIILLLELLNLIFKKKAIGGINFFLIFVMILVAAVAYLTGLTDGKEAYPALTEAGKTALSEHKLLGTYLLLAPAVVFVFKFLAAVTKNGFMKFLYIVVLMGLVYGIFVQGKEGGELVYEHGMNVEKVSTLDDELFDLREEIEEMNEKLAEKAAVSTPVSTPAPVPAVTPTAPVVEAPKVESKPEIPAVQEVAESAPVAVETPEVKVISEVPAVETPAVVTPTIEAPSAPVETLRTEMKEEVPVP